MRSIHIRPLSTIVEMHEIQEVEKAVWNMQPIPVHHTFTSLKNGGVLLGAYDGDCMIGFLYSFPGFHNGVSYLCSHMMGLLPAYQKKGLGSRLKWKQAEIAKEIGYRIITWTFDPLESKNAYLNLHKLGAVGAQFKANHYGYMQDDLNRGLPSDRLQIKWDLIADRSDGDCAHKTRNIVLRPDKDGTPFVEEVFYSGNFSDDEAYLMAIPVYFQEMKHKNFELAKSWRLKTGKILQALFERGFQATDLTMGDEEDYRYYILTK